MYSKICIILICFMLLSSVGCGSIKKAEPPSETLKSQPQGILKENWNIAVFPFDVEGKSKLSGKGAMDLVISELIGLEGYKVLEEDQLRKAMNQIGIAISDLVDQENQVKVGNLLGARLHCYGRINKSLELITARVVLTETREQLFIVKTQNKDELKGIVEISKMLKEKLESPGIIAQLNRYSGKTEVTEVAPPETVKVRGYGAILEGDMITAKEIALKDAYSKAIEQVCGVKLIRETQVENFQLVRDKILTESIGYVNSYEIMEENPQSPLGYEVLVNASVSRQPLSDIEKLPIMVKYLLANPRVAIIVDGLEKKHATIVESQIASRFTKAGFSVVDNKIVEEKRKEFADPKSDEDSAKLAGMLRADIIIRGDVVTEITTAIKKIDGVELDTPPLAATTTGAFRIILAETADVISVFSHESLSRNQKVGYGSTEEAASKNSLENFTQASGDKLVWQLAANLGGPTKLRILLKNVTMAQATNFQQQLQDMAKNIVIQVEMQRYDKNIAEYRVESAVKTMIFQKKLLESVEPSKLNVKELIVDKIDFGTITISLGI